jgi:hypothetical protein
MVPGGVDDEPGGDGDGGQREEKGQGEHGFASGAGPAGVPGALLGSFSHGSATGGPQSPFLAGSVEVFSGFFSEVSLEAPFVPESPLLTVGLSGASVFAALL